MTAPLVRSTREQNLKKGVLWKGGSVMLEPDVFSVLTVEFRLGGIGRNYVQEAVRCAHSTRIRLLRELEKCGGALLAPPVRIEAFGMVLKSSVGKCLDLTPHTPYLLQEGHVPSWHETLCSVKLCLATEDHLGAPQHILVYQSKSSGDVFVHSMSVNGVAINTLYHRGHEAPEFVLDVASRLARANRSLIRSLEPLPILRDYPLEERPLAATEVLDAVLRLG